MAFNNNKGEVPFPFEITPVEPEINSELLKYFHGERTGFVQVGPEKYFFPSKYKKCAENYYNFQARPDDIWIATFPRFYIFLHDEVKKELLKENSDDQNKQKFIEIISTPGYESFAEMQERRFIKTHFPFSLLPPSLMEQQSKVIYVARNPKDVAVSFYHLNRLYRTQGYVGDFPRYWNYFQRSLNPWMPYFSHIKEGWMNRHKPNVLFMFYEDMNRNFPETIRKVGNFLGETLDDEQIENLVNYLSIDNFKNNPAVNGKELKDVKVLKNGEAGFVRNGKSGSWKEEFTPEMLKEANEWIEMNLKDTDIHFP